MKTKLLPLLLIFSLAAIGQGCKTDCEKLLDKMPYFVRDRANENKDSLQLDFAILKDCGKLDSVDAELLNGPMLGTVLLRSVAENKVLSYRTILENIDAFRKSSDYPKFREAAIISKRLAGKTASLSTFDQDKRLFALAGIPHAEIEPFRLFLEAHAGETMTYKEAYLKYRSSKPDSKPYTSKRTEFRNLVDLEQALKAGKDEHKHILIYFSAHASVNCRKMEDRVFSDEEVNRFLLQKFVYFVAYLDDNSPDEQFGTVGKRYIKLQSEKFGSEFQPYFYILDEKGKVTSEMMYTSDPKQFMDFLTKGLN